MQKTEDERLALIELSRVVGQFPFLEADINPLIIRLVTKGTVTPEVVRLAQEHGMPAARREFRKLYFFQPTLEQAKLEIEAYLQNNNIVLDK